MARPRRLPLIEGGCHCGFCRYRLALDRLDDVAHCHCDICRRTTGAVLVTWATVATDHFSWRGGAPAVYRSSTQGRRFFCPHCGAQLAIVHDGYPGTIDITIGTLDAPGRFPPDRHIWSVDRLPWLQVDPQLPAHPGER
jgi:hypothetical protein